MDKAQGSLEVKVRDLQLVEGPFELLLKFLESVERSLLPLLVVTVLDPQLTEEGLHVKVHGGCVPDVEERV